MNKNILFKLFLIIIASLVLSACGEYDSNNDGVNDADWWPIDGFVAVTPTAQATQAQPNTAATQTPWIITATPAAFPATATVQPSSTLPPTATATPTVPTAPISVSTTVVGDFQPGWTTTWYWSPFRGTTDVLTDTATQDTFAEPGVLLDATAAYDHMSAADTPILVPEGGYAYIAIGAVTLNHKGARLNLYHQENNIYLIIIRGNPDDGTSADLNEIVLATDYVRGAGIYSPMPSGAYVSLGWFLQQIQASYRDPNCGRGCQKVTIVIVDLPTHSYRMWQTSDPNNLRSWTRVP